MNSPEINEQAELDRALRGLFGSDDVVVSNWNQQAPGTPGVSGAIVTRLSGTASVDGQPRPWSLIRKWIMSPERRQVNPTARNETPSGIDYWKREFLVYQSGVLDDLPAGFTRPRCLHTQEQEDGCTLWLEVVEEELTIWPLSRYDLAAYHLGCFNGSYLSARALPDYPWLSVEIAQQRERKNGELFAQFDELRQHPVVRRGWPDEVADGILRIWQEREQFYRILRQLPQVFQHGDAGRRNLMAVTGKNGASKTFAIDWGYAGVGAVGEEIAATVISPAIWYQGVTPEQLPELEAIVLDGYIAGLRQAGWHGDGQLARLGYLCSVALRYGPMITIPEILALNWKNGDEVKQRFGWSIEEWADTLAPIRHFVIQRADQARQLMA